MISLFPAFRIPDSGISCRKRAVPPTGPRTVSSITYKQLQLVKLIVPNKQLLMVSYVFFFHLHSRPYIIWHTWPRFL